MRSTGQKGSLRMVHMPSYTVFSNWPTKSTPVYNITSMDFSPKGDLFAFGNTSGTVLLYKLTHYDSEWK